MTPPNTPAKFRAYLAKRDGERNLGFFAVSDADDLLGVINVNEIVRGAFHSGYLGYYAFAPYHGQGLMTAALSKVIATAFRKHQQPGLPAVDWGRRCSAMQERAARGRTDRASIVVAADAETVYRAFEDAESLMTWLPPGGMTGRALQYEFREGGRYRIELTYAEGDSGKTTANSDISAGRFVTLEPGKRIVQTVELESTDDSLAGEMRMSWSFEPLESGTKVTITAENVPSGISKEDHDEGLRASLKNLTSYLQ